MVLDVGQIKIRQELLECLAPSLNFDEELLRMRPRLSASARADMLLNTAPFLTEEFESFKEPEVLVLGPASLLLTVAIWVVMRLSIE